MLLQSLTTRSSPLTILPSTNLALNLSTPLPTPNITTPSLLNNWPTLPFQITYATDTIMTITSYGSFSNPFLIDDIITNLWDIELEFRAQGLPHDIVDIQTFTDGHVTIHVDPGTSPPAPSFLTRTAVCGILGVVRRLTARYGPRDILKADVRTDWRPVASFWVHIRDELGLGE